MWQWLQPTQFVATDPPLMAGDCPLCRDTEHHSVIPLAMWDVFLFSPLAESLDVTGRGCLTQKSGQLSQLL